MTSSGPVDLGVRIAVCIATIDVGIALGLDCQRANILATDARRASATASQLQGTAGDTTRYTHVMRAVARLESATAVVARAVAARLAADARARRNDLRALGVGGAR